MRASLTIVSASLVVVGCGGASQPTAPQSKERPSTPSRPPVAATAWNFDADRGELAPAGFSFGRTGGGPPGRWIVRPESDAPSPPNVLAQLDADDTDDRFPLAVVTTPRLRDLRLSVRCKVVSGEVDQACGLVFRYRDENNYYITRANALEGNIRLYCVEDGSRRQIASWRGEVSARVWHEYVTEVQGDHIRVLWDGAVILDERDSTFPDAGNVGVWTKADSVTYFDDLTVTPLEAGHSP